MTSRDEKDPIDEITKSAKGHYDMTEEGSKRPGDAEATKLARQEGTMDDFNGEARESISRPNDSSAENKVATSLDDE